MITPLHRVCVSFSACVAKMRRTLLVDGRRWPTQTAAQKNGGKPGAVGWCRGVTNPQPGRLTASMVRAHLLIHRRRQEDIGGSRNRDGAPSCVVSLRGSAQVPPPLGISGRAELSCPLHGREVLEQVEVLLYRRDSPSTADFLRQVPQGLSAKAQQVRPYSKLLQALPNREERWPNGLVQTSMRLWRSRIAACVSSPSPTATASSPCSRSSSLRLRLPLRVDSISFLFYLRFPRFLHLSHPSPHLHPRRLAL